MTSSDPQLPHVLSGQRCEIHHPRVGLLSYYVDGPDRESGVPSGPTPPLLLVHSINAAASAHEVKPLFDAFKKVRRTYALDLPGFGHSERSDRTYDQGLMVTAIEALVAEIRSKEQCREIDALAVSLASEFLAKVALRRPDEIRSLALVSPTGFARDTATGGPPEADCRRPGVLRVLDLPLLGKALFRLLTSRPSIRFFLQRTWGSKQIDEDMFRASCRVCRADGAHRAPFHFIAGYLFSADIPSVFQALEQPVWLAHGVRGAFADFSRVAHFADEPNWRITTFQTGAMPHFEAREAFIDEYTRFLRCVGERRPDRRSTDDGS